MVRVRLCAILTLIGCYSPPDKSCLIRCVPGAAAGCPGDLTCGSDGFCTNGEQCTTQLATVQTGAVHACGLDTTGRVLCWGDNHQSQLGLMGTLAEPAPRFITDGFTRFIAVAAGGLHTCALRDDGHVLCWGNDSDGESAGGKGNAIMIPTAVTTSPTAQPPAFEQIAAGGSHSCAIGAGQLWCWGAREYLGFAADVSFMTRIGTRTDWTAISLGSRHTCGIAGGELSCWGDNESGQAGGLASPPVMMPQPIVVAGKVPIVVSAGGDNTCGIFADAAGAATGELWCWGDDTEEQIVAGNTADVTTPTRIGTSSSWSKVSVGSVNLCGIDDGHALCWGNAIGGANGNGRWASRHTVEEPQDIGLADDIHLGIQTRSQDWAELGCLQQGTQVMCWGANYRGEVGMDVLGTEHADPIAIAAPNGRAWKTVVTGRHHTCGQTGDGAVFCWGADGDGQITASVPRGGAANPCIASEPCDAPTPQPAPSQIATPDELVTAYDSTCARQGSTITCWGSPRDGVLAMQIDYPTVSTVPPPPGQQWTRLLGGDRALCGRASNGALACWGRLPNMPTYTPMLENDIDLQSITNIRFGDDFACAARLDGGRTCWGDNNLAQLGNGLTSGTVNSPMPIYNAVVSFVAAHNDHGCALTTASGVVCWGANYQSSGGQPDSDPYEVTPLAIASATGPLANCSELEIATNYACAICGGSVWCWGGNYQFELGRGFTSNRYPDPKAAQVNLPAGTYAHLAVGTEHACAIGDAGVLYCWGYGLNGQIGDGTHGACYPTPLARAR